MFYTWQRRIHFILTVLRINLGFKFLLKPFVTMKKVCSNYNKVDLSIGIILIRRMTSFQGVKFYIYKGYIKSVLNMHGVVLT